MAVNYLHIAQSGIFIVKPYPKSLNKIVNSVRTIKCNTFLCAIFLALRFLHFYIRLLQPRILDTRYWLYSRCELTGQFVIAVNWSNQGNVMKLVVDFIIQTHHDGGATLTNLNLVPFCKFLFLLVTSSNEHKARGMRHLMIE